MIDVTAQMPDTWLDSAGNHHSNSIHVVERFTALSENHIMYEATIETRRPTRVPGPCGSRSTGASTRTCSCFEFKCVEFAEELMYGHLRKDPDLTPTYRPTGFGSAFEGDAPGPR